MFFREIDDSTFSYPVPKEKKKDEVKDCYVRGVRKKFKLTPNDGVSDSEFFSRG
jgi:hypothetical protein